MSQAYKYIYIERRALAYDRTQEILGHFPRAKQIIIEHYKDLFARRRQDIGLQIRHRSLILAVREEEGVYAGAPVCQDFGNAHFYYASSVMNCPFDCQYCYLKGMYPSANIVVFVNLEQIMDRVDLLLSQHAVYLCVSYDSDLLALEGILGYVRAWADFAKTREGLTLEIRTKAAKQSGWEPYQDRRDLTFAWTLSPERYARELEAGAASLAGRLSSIESAIAAGVRVRLALDPMIYRPNWREAYGDLIEQIFARISPADIVDISIGSFRISSSYLKQMRRNMPKSALVQFPFVTEGGYCHYPDPLVEEMEGFVRERLLEFVKEEQIFTWQEEMEAGKN